MALPTKELEKDRRLTGRQEIFARAIASGLTQQKAAMVAGYSPLTSTQSFRGHELAKQPVVKARIQDLIQIQNLEHLVISHWVQVLSEEVSDYKPLVKARIWDSKAKAIDQIARLGGWELPKESVQKVLKANVSILPDGFKINSKGKSQPEIIQNTRDNVQSDQKESVESQEDQDLELDRVG